MIDVWNMCYDYRATETANSRYSQRVLDKCHSELDEGAEHIRGSAVFTFVQIHQCKLITFTTLTINNITRVLKESEN